MNGPKAKPLAERFWSKVDKTDGCWLWTAGSGSHGYGCLPMKDSGVWRSRLAHRISYEIANGPIPEGAEVDHICGVRRCVKPSHLRAATHKQNSENLQGPHRDSRSGVRGVCWDNSKKKWLARVHHAGKNIQVGRFTSIEDARAAVVAKRLELFTHNNMDRIAS